MKILLLQVMLFFICSVVLLSILYTAVPDKEIMMLYAHASESYAQGQFAETTEILRGVKKFPPAVMLRAKAEYFAGDAHKAEKSCQLVLKMRPSSYEAKIYLVMILREKGDLSGAVKITESLLADNPQDIRILRLAAELAADADKDDEALVFLNKAVELSAESARVLLDRARLRWGAGKGHEALDDLRRAKAMLPWDTPLLRAIINLENRITEVM